MTTKIQDFQLKHDRLGAVESEIQGARGEKPDLKSYIDSKGGAVNDFKLMSATASNNDVTVTISSGRAVINDVLIEKLNDTTILITSALANTSYHFYLLSDETLTYNTSGIKPNGSLYLGVAQTAATVNELTVADKRAMLVQGGNSQEVIDARGNFGALDGRLDDIQLTTEAIEAEVVEARSAFGSLKLKLDDIAANTGTPQELVDARGSYLSLDDRLNAMAGSSGAVTFTELFTDQVYVDVDRTDSIITTQGAMVEKGSVITSDFSNADQIDTVASSAIIDTAAQEVRSNRINATAMMVTKQFPTNGTQNVMLETTEVHETALGAAPESLYTTSTWSGSYSAAVTDFNRRAWAFWSSNSTTHQVNCNVYNADGTVYQANRTMSIPTSLPISWLEALTAPDGSVWLFAAYGNGSSHYVAHQRFTGTSPTTGLISSLSVLATPPSQLYTTIDQNDRIWLLAVVSTTVRYAIFNTDGSVYADWRVIETTQNALGCRNPAILGLTNGQVLIVYSDLLETGRSVYRLCAIRYTTDGTLLDTQPLVICDKIPGIAHSSPGLLQMPGGQVVIIGKDGGGLYRFMLDPIVWTVSYRPSSALVQDIKPVPDWNAAATLQTFGGTAYLNNYGYIIRPTRRVTFHGVKAHLRNNHSTSQFNGYYKLYRWIGTSWQQIMSQSIQPIAAGTEAVIAVDNSVFDLIPGETYFVGVNGDSTLGIYYTSGDTIGGGVTTHEFGTLETATLSTNALTQPAVVNTIPYRIQLCMDTDGWLFRNREYYHYNKVPVFYEPNDGDDSVAILFRQGNDTYQSTTNDYSNTAYMELDPTTWAIRSTFKLDNSSNRYAYSLSATRCFKGVFLTFCRELQSSTYYLVINRTINASTSISYQVSPNDGATWYALTPGASVATASGTMLQLRATFNSARTGKTSTLKAFTLKEWGTQNLIKGKSYTLSQSPHTSYGFADAGNQLTDGDAISATGYNSGGWVGFLNPYPSLDIYFDLGLPSNLTMAQAYVGSQTTTYSIYYPEWIAVDGSNDNINWTQLGYTDYTSQADSTTSLGRRWMTATVPGSSGEWRYARVRLGNLNGNPRYLIASEIEVYGNAGIKRSLYSKPITAISPVARATISPMAELNGGTIDYFMSIDGGANWNSVVPNQPFIFDTWGSSDLRIRADLISPASEVISPVLRKYTVVSSDLVAASTVERRMKDREREITKMALQLNTLSGASKNQLVATVSDAFNDDTGIDQALSTYHFDSTNKLVTTRTETLDQSVPGPATVTTYYAGRYNSSSTDASHGQKFTAGQTGSLTKVSLLINAVVGSPGELIAEIWNDNFATLLATSIPVTKNMIDSNILAAQKTTFNFSQPAYITAGSVYNAVVRLVIPLSDGSHYYNLSGVDADSYAGGSRMHRTTSAGAWTSYATSDLIFDTYVGTGNTATVISTMDTAEVLPTKIWLTAEENLNAGSILYHVSRDNGQTWTTIIKDAVTDIDTQPIDTRVRMKAEIMGNAQLLGWGYGWY